ncbi:MAG: nuclear transport factor 2 family protein [Alphaproteobacteria bacterium]|nr:MAG: nuclear transport factor 2 family protein [Alphaproteobacteria bacterium]
MTATPIPASVRIAGQTPPEAVARFVRLATSGVKDEAALAELLAPDVAFLPPTYWATWRGRAPVAAILGHVGEVFRDFRYRRIMGGGADWALEFTCRVGERDAVGVDLLTLDDEGRIARFEVAMRPVGTVALLREEMMRRVSSDPRFAAFAGALAKGQGG